MTVSAGLISWKSANQISPIILTGGIALSQGGGIPIVNFTNPGTTGLTSTVNGVTVSGQVSDENVDAQLDGFNANFYPAQGSTLLDFQAATYPFANQAVAANALIANPLNISMIMSFPATGDFPYSTRQNTLIALVNTLKQHAILGGLYSVVTPGYIYTNCILLRLTDISGDLRHPQEQLKWDFFQPLVSQQAAQQAQNNLTQTITNGTQPSGSLSNFATGLPTPNPGSATSNAPSPLIQ